MKTVSRAICGIALTAIASSTQAQIPHWMKCYASPQYLPVVNPDYDATKDPRNYPFNDMSAAVRAEK